MIRWWVRAIISSVRRCDACERVRMTRYSPAHGAHFCAKHYRENNR